MGRSFFVTPETKVLNLPEGNWIEVKCRLTVKEERQSFQQIIGEVNREGWQRPNVEMLGIAEVHAYIVDWGGDGFRDPEGRRVEPTLASIQAMDKDAFAAIEQVVKTHVKAMEQEEIERKNAQGTSPASAPTS